MMNEGNLGQIRQIEKMYSSRDNGSERRRSPSPRGRTSPRRPVSPFRDRYSPPRDRYSPSRRSPDRDRRSSSSSRHSSRRSRSPRDRDRDRDRHSSHHSSRRSRSPRRRSRSPGSGSKRHRDDRPDLDGPERLSKSAAYSRPDEAPRPIDDGPRPYSDGRDRPDPRMEPSRSAPPPPDSYRREPYHSHPPPPRGPPSRDSYGPEPPPTAPPAREKIDYSSYDDIPVETSGRDVPKGISTFDEHPEVPSIILDNLRSIGYTKPTPVQKNSLPIVLANRDLMACAQTGSGKTAAFLLPILSKLIRQNLGGGNSSISMTDHYVRRVSPLALVLAPTRELASQIEEEARKFAARTGLKCAVVYGGSPVVTQLRTLDQGCDILVATPGRLVDFLDREKVSLAKIRYLVLDEADRMLDMGFEPQIRKIVEGKDMTARGQRRTLMFSATFPKEIQKLASQFLEDYVFLAVGRVGSATELVKQKFVKVDDGGKTSALLDLLSKHPKGTLTLIFVETKKECDWIGRFLLKQGFPATSIHGDRDQRERTMALRTFTSGETPYLVATNVAARGLDIENVGHVVNYDMPSDIDDYVHRIGRTGRAGKAGVSTSFLAPSNGNLIARLMDILEDAGQEIPPWMDAMKLDKTPRTKRPPGAGRGGPRFGGRDFRTEGNGMGRGYPPPQGGRGYGPPMGGYGGPPYGGGGYGYGAPPPSHGGYGYPPSGYPPPPANGGYGYPPSSYGGYEGYGYGGPPPPAGPPPPSAANPPPPPPTDAPRP
eukprot:TRINITY_DN225_c0_g1_i1.p1 TRINITY_DN225_c0_g1~~TRINITY_DN225_c0_g1_i1.p1  ORF type:complete len:766 (-),score=201.18 TRINITY_DN225_c0_g1_i1:79-2376(-)